MRLKLFSIVALLMVGAATTVHGAGVSPRADVLFDIGGFPITNSIATGWLITLAIILGVRLAVGTPRLVPGRGQAIIEGVVGGLRDLVAPIIGKKALAVSLPFVLGFFFYIVLHNWSGLFPGVGSLGTGYTDAEGTFHLTHPFIRPANADWNGTIALALVAMTAWLFICIRCAGVKVILYDLFGNKADKKEIGGGMYLLLTLMFLVVGVIEVVSILIRPFTLSIRLFGNIFGGENLLHNTGFVFPFYFLELLVGLVQGLVFILLFSVYIGLICNHDEGHDHDHDHEHKEGHAH